MPETKPAWAQLGYFRGEKKCERGRVEERKGR